MTFRGLLFIAACWVVTLTVAAAAFFLAFPPTGGPR